MINLLANLIIFGHANIMKILKLIASASLMVIAACSAPEPKAQPRIAEAPKPIALPAPPAVQAATIIQPTGDWIDWPISAGDWVYRQDDRGSIALFGPTGQDAILTLRCMKNDRQLFLSRAGSATNGATMTIRTSHMLKSYDASPTGGSPAFTAIAINSNDGILDAIAHTRGRFAVEVTGMKSIAVPSWSEIVRVTQDCR